MALVVAGLGLQAVASPASDPAKIADIPVEGVVTNPDWVSKPTADQLSVVFPAVAQVLNIGGKAEINCKVTAQGDAADCKVITETPMGMGFGVAALSLAPYFKFRPRMVDGAPVGGAGVNIPINFQLPDTPEALSAAPMVDSPTAAALELARRIIAASGTTPAIPLDLSRWVASLDQLERSLPANGDGAAQREALDVVKASLEQAEPQFRDARAQAIAQSFTDDELAKIAAFFDTPAGRAWASRLPSVDTLETQQTLTILKGAQAAARERYCEMGHCSTTPAKGPGGP